MAERISCRDLLAHAPVAAAAADAPAALKIAVLFATQSGTAEGLARKLAKELKARGHVASLTSLEGYMPATLAAERHAIFIASTYGEGDPPDSVQPFFQQLCLDTLSELSGSFLCGARSGRFHVRALLQVRCRSGPEACCAWRHANHAIASIAMSTSTRRLTRGSPGCSSGLTIAAAECAGAYGAS